MSQQAISLLKQAIENLENAVMLAEDECFRDAAFWCRQASMQIDSADDLLFETDKQKGLEDGGHSHEN